MRFEESKQNISNKLNEDQVKQRVNYPEEHVKTLRNRTIPTVLKTIHIYGDTVRERQGYL